MIKKLRFIYAIIAHIARFLQDRDSSLKIILFCTACGPLLPPSVTVVFKLQKSQPPRPAVANGYSLHTDTDASDVGARENQRQIFAEQAAGHTVPILVQQLSLHQIGTDDGDDTLGITSCSNNGRISDLCGQLPFRQLQSESCCFS